MTEMEKVRLLFVFTLGLVLGVNIMGWAILLEEVLR